MTPVHALKKRLEATGEPYLIAVKTVDGGIRVGALGCLTHTVVELYPPERSPNIPEEYDLTVNAFLSISHIISAWEAE